MTHNSETGELVCFAPVGEEVLRTVESDFSKAHAISAAIQEAYRKGSIIGRREMQLSVEHHMSELTSLAVGRTDLRGYVKQTCRQRDVSGEQQANEGTAAIAANGRVDHNVGRL